MWENPGPVRTWYAATVRLRWRQRLGPVRKAGQVHGRGLPLPPSCSPGALRDQLADRYRTEWPAGMGQPQLAPAPEPHPARSNQDRIRGSVVCRPTADNELGSRKCAHGGQRGVA